MFAPVTNNGGHLPMTASPRRPSLPAITNLQNIGLAYQSPLKVAAKQIFAMSPREHVQ